MTKRSTIGLIVMLAIAFVIGFMIYNKIVRHRSENVVFNNIAIVDAALKDSTSSYYVDFAHIDKDIHLLPIAIMVEDTNQFSMLNFMNDMDLFDNITGAGSSDGIVDFAGERLLFFADMAHAPYDGYDGDGLRELVIKNAISLLQEKATLPKIFILNDPLAAIYAKKELESLLNQSKSGIKTISIVDASVNELFDSIDTTENESFAVGVIGSEDVISSNGFQDAIKDAIITRGITSDIQIIAQKYSADSTIIHYFEPGEGIVTKWNVSLNAIDSVYRKRTILEDGSPVELKAIIIANNEYYKAAEEYILQANVPCKIIYPEKSAAMDCYRTLRKESNLSMRISKKSQQVYFSVSDENGTTQNVCINPL